MEKHRTFDPSIKFKPDYQWPQEGTHRQCPRCGIEMQLNENAETYFGKPWWCSKCQWQFSEEELDQA